MDILDFDDQMGKWSLAKSRLLILSGDPIPPVRNIPCEQNGSTVTYLGLPRGIDNNDRALVPVLESRIFSRLRQWKYRARTVAGRLLLVNTMVLSVIWHYTQHVNVPVATVRRWQRAVNAFVLSRKTEPADRTLHLIRAEFLYLPRSQQGLGFPNIAMSLQRQRLRALQRFVVANREAQAPLWVLPARESWKEIYPSLGTVDPLDFLHASPSVRSHLIDRAAVSDWWMDTWRVWSRTAWPIAPNSLAQEDWPTGISTAPMWISTSSVFQVSAGTKTRGLLAIAEPQRSFRTRLAREFRLQRLSDLTHTLQGWPTLQAFIERYAAALSTGTTAHTIKMRWIRSLYNELTEIWSRLPSHEDTQNSQPTTPPVGITTGSRIVFFPNISSAGYRRLLATKPPNKAHPATSHDTTFDAETVGRVLRFGAYQRRRLLPVYHDVWIRLVFRLLPVRSRLWFLQRQDPSAIQCPVPSCNNVETYAHLFLECRPAAAEVWSAIWDDWRSQLSGDLTLASLLGCPRPRNVSSSSHAAAVDTLWHITRAITIRVLWINRNKIVFESVPPRTKTAMVTEIYALFAAHYRALLRHTPLEEHADFNRVILMLLRSRSFSLFFTSRRQLLTIRRRNTRN